MQHRLGLSGASLAGRCCVVVLAGGGLLGALVWQSDDVAPLELQRRLAGRFVVDEPRPQIEMRLGQAVERVVEPLGAATRSVVRAQLSRVVAYCRGYRFATRAGGLQVQCDDSAAVDHVLDRGAIHEAAPPSAPLEVELEEDGEVLEAITDSGARTTTYRFDDAGRLEVQVRVESEQLDRALGWSVRYRRATPGDPPATPSVAASLTSP